MTCFIAAIALLPSNIAEPLIVEDKLGKPLQGASVYATGFGFERSAEEWGATDKNGRINNRKTTPRTELIAVTKDGRIATAARNDKIVVGETGEVRIHLTDGYGNPLAGRGVMLFPVLQPAPLRGVVINRGMPNLPDELDRRLSSKSNVNGDVSFRRICVGSNFSVTVDGLGMMAGVLEGSVQPNHPASVAIPLDRVLSGRLFKLRSGKPVSGASVMVVGPGYHNFMGSAVTDARGNYTLPGLPAGNYSLVTNDLRAKGEPDDGTFDWLAESRNQKGEWLGRRGTPGYSLVKGSIKNADVAYVEAVRITATVVDKSGRPKSGCWVSIQYPDGGGEGRQTDAKGVSRLAVFAGTLKFIVTEDDEGKHVLTTRSEVLEEGSHPNLKFVVGD